MLVLDKEDGHAVGTYALNHVVDRDVWTLSYVNRYDDWGKGYTTEGMKAFMEHATKVYGARTFPSSKSTNLSLSDKPVSSKSQQRTKE